MARLQITGAAQVIVNIRGVTSQMAARVPTALVTAGLRLQRASQQLVPVEFGNLQGSAYTAQKGRGFNTVVEVGYTSAYALFVHEKVGMVLRGQPRRPSPPHIGRYWDPQGQAQAKFLETPARSLAPDLVQEIVSILRL